MHRRETARANLVRLPMEQLLIIAATFFALWLLFIRPQQRRVRAHQALVATLEPGDEPRHRRARREQSDREVAVAFVLFNDVGEVA